MVRASRRRAHRCAEKSGYGGDETFKRPTVVAGRRETASLCSESWRTGAM